MKRSLGFMLLVLIHCPAGAAPAPSSEFAGPEPRPQPGTLTVQQAVQMALERAPEVLLAEAQAARAGEALREIRSLNRPQVVTGTGLAYNNGYPLSMEGAAPSIFQIAASQAVFSKRNRNLIREAEEAGKASRWEKESARNELAARAASVYCELYRSRKAAELAAAELDAAQKRREFVQAQFEAGKVRPVDLTLARNAASAAQHQLLAAREQARVAETELRSLTGMGEEAPLQVVQPDIQSSIFDMTAEALYQLALEQTPEIQQAEANIRAREFHLEADKGERLPQMDIIGQYALFSRTNNYDDFFNRFTRNNFLVGLSLQVPIFDGSRTGARIAQSRHEVSEARYRLERAQKELKLNVQRGLSAVRVARGDCDLARKDLESAREMVQVGEALFEAGRISAGEMEDLRAQLNQKEKALLDMDRALSQRKLELLRVIGAAALIR